MKKTICFILSLFVILFGITNVSAEAPTGWTADFPDNVTVNDDGSVTFSGKVNTTIKLDEAITGDFTLEVKVTAPALTEGVDQKAIVAVMGLDNNWMTGYWLRLYDTVSQFNDGTNNTYAAPGALLATPTIKTGGEFNDVKVERVGNELTYTINGTEVLKITPAVTTGNNIFIGANFSAANQDDISKITETVTFKDLKITAGGETYTYFSEGSSSSEPNVPTGDYFSEILMIAAFSLLVLGILLKAKRTA